MTACMLMLALGGAADDEEEIVYTKERAFRIPLELTEAERKTAAWIRLMVSTDGGKTWNRVREESPKRPTVTFRAPGDGSYWLALAVVGHDERMRPANPADLKPGLKVVIDSSKPEIALEAVKTRSGLRGVRWTLKDGTPEEKMTLKCAVWDERAKTWKPRSLTECRNHTIWFGRSEIVAKMQLSVGDAAGNEAVEQIDIDGDRFLCSDQESFILGVRAPTPTQFVESAKKPVESRTMAEIEQASARAAAESMGKKPAKEPPVLADASPLPKEKPAKAAKQQAEGPADEPPPPKKQAMAETKPVAEPLKAKPTPEDAMPTLPPEETKPVVADKPAQKPAAEEPVKKPAEETIDVTYSNRRSTVLHYEMTAIPKGEAVELWGLKTGGKGWVRLGRDVDGASPMEAMFPEDGRWGVLLVVGDAAGSGKPRQEEAPSTWVEVDTKQPKVEIEAVRKEKKGMRIVWKALDANVVDDSVRLFYSREPAGPWETIAVQQASDGDYLWKAAEEAMAKPIHLRIDATDRAGNIGTATTPKPIKKDGDADESETAGVETAPAKPAKKAESEPQKEE